jgi:hypothetical protein
MMDEHNSRRCGVCKVPHFERNHFFHGKLLGARDLADEQKYFNEKRWLINRMVLGWGVVCGLDVELEHECLVITPGLALDCCGHELLVCQPERLSAKAIADALGVQPRPEPPYKPDPASPKPRDGYEPEPGYGGEGGGEPIPWALCIEYRECRIEPVKQPAGCEAKDHDREYNRIRDDHRLVVRRPSDVCPDDYGDECCRLDSPGQRAPLHKTLVDHARECHTCRDCECVLLATGTLTTGSGELRLRLDDDRWRYRPIVYTNHALADLLRCFHGGLAHIESMNWEPGARFDVDDFLDRLTRNHLRVTFDQPMNPESVKNPRSCRLSIFYAPEDRRCAMPLLIPVDRIEYSDRTATYVFDDDCIEHELRRACRKLRRSAEIELILHGSMMHDQKGRALDAELIRNFPTGNGTEGGDFVTYFTVGP